jgi:membrane-bound lytic murein transglycosylase A
MRLTAIFFCLLASCARAPIKTADEAMRLSARVPEFADDLNFTSFIPCFEADIRQLKSSSVDLVFGPRRIPRQSYIRALEFLLIKAKEDPGGESFREALKNNFEPYEVYGQDDWGQVFITSYFEPELEGSLSKSERFSQPLYGVPRDMVAIDLNTYQTVPSGLEQRSREGILRGRLIPAASRDEIPKVVAFPDRASFDAEKGNRQSEILAWVDPVDAFFLEIQGSGAVKFKDGKELRLGYAAQNGHPYVPIGKALTEFIPKEKITLQSIEEHLRRAGPDEARRLMNINPSYVFFRKLQSAGLTYFGTEVAAGRTIATDQKFFPKGALAYLEFEKPRFNSASDNEPAGWEKVSRFVFDQDTGGAIRGPHRVDLFWGKGAQAKQSAGVMKGMGRLVYLVPSPKFLSQLK